MSDQLKNDLTSYMDYNKQAMRSSKPGAYRDADARSGISAAASEAYAR